MIDELYGIADKLRNGKLLLIEVDNYRDSVMDYHQFNFRFTDDMKWWTPFPMDAEKQIFLDLVDHMKNQGGQSKEIAILRFDVSTQMPVVQNMAGHTVAKLQGSTEFDIEMHVSGSLMQTITTRGPYVHTYPPSPGLSAAFAQMMNALGGNPQPMIIGASQIEEKQPVELEDAGLTLEPIVGYRDFEILWRTDDCRLYSRNGEMWAPRERMVAVCVSQGRQFIDHDAPDANCERKCGIYAFSSPSHKDLQVSSAAVWGEVNLWGEVLICPTGWRAEYAYPKTLFVRDHGTKMSGRVRDRLEAAYGIPVHLVEHREGITSDEYIDKALSLLTQEGGENK